MEVNLFINQKTNGNTYVINRENDCYIVDPGGFDMSESINYIKEKNYNLLGILLTHGHYDHIIGIPEILEYKKVPVYVSEKDYEFLFDSTLSLSIWLDIDFKLSNDVEIVKLKENDDVFGLKVIETPGHTHGGICYYDKENSILLSGDTIFKMNYGRTDLPTGSISGMKKSISKLMNLSENTTVYPGHGGETIIKYEKEGYTY